MPMCCGYKRGHHMVGHGTVLDNGLCPACRDLLDEDLSAQRAAQHQPRHAQRCGDHWLGEEYYSCVRCYGD